MKTTRSVLMGLLMAGCASPSPDSSGGTTTLRITGPPEVVITLPGRVTENQLVNGVPPIRIESPPEVTASLIFFADTDGNGSVSPGEYSISFRALPDSGGSSIAGVRLTPMQVQKLGRSKRYGVEVKVPGSAKPTFYMRTIE